MIFSCMSRILNLITAITREPYVLFTQTKFLWNQEINTLLLVPNKAMQDLQTVILIFWVN